MHISQSQPDLTISLGRAPATEKGGGEEQFLVLCMGLGREKKLEIFHLRGWEGRIEGKGTAGTVLERRLRLERGREGRRKTFVHPFVPPSAKHARRFNKYFPKTYLFPAIWVYQNQAIQQFEKGTYQLENFIPPILSSISLFVHSASVGGGGRC